MTKLFNLGLPRTGTTSFSGAASIAGFRSLHSNRGEIEFLFPDIPLFETGRPSRFDLVIDRYDVFSDLPWYAMAKTLARAFPSASFVATTRCPEKWCQSILKIRPHIITEVEVEFHRAFFETAIFDGDSAKLMDIYECHMAQIRKITQGRLVEIPLEESSDSNWKRLCGVLKVPIPACPWPRLNC